MPTFEKPLLVHRPATLDQEELGIHIRNIMGRRQYSNDGPVVRAFEEAIAEEAGTAHAVACSSGTTAITLMLMAGNPLRTRVALPAFTFPGTLLGVIAARQPEKIEDVDLCDGLLPAGRSPDEVRLGVHLWGQFPCAEGEGIHFYDGAHAMGCRVGGRRCGSWGTATALSFHATKIVTTGEGGAVVTNDEGLAREVRELRNFGFRPRKPDGEVVAPWEVGWPGTRGMNAKMSEFSAAVGLVSLSRLPMRLEECHRARRAYEVCLDGIGGLSRILTPPGNSDYHMIVRVVPLEGETTEALGRRRDRIVRGLWDEGVHARRYFHPGLHVSTGRGGNFPVTDLWAASLIHLPTGDAVTDEEIAAVCRLLAELVKA